MRHLAMTAFSLAVALGARAPAAPEAGPAAAPTQAGSGAAAGRGDAPGAEALTGTLTIAAAANLKPALDELGAAFEAAHPGARVLAAYGASGAFLAQLENGAPFDLFLAADTAFPARLAAAGRSEGPPFDYALGRLVLWVPAGSPLPIEREGLAALRTPALQRLAIGNPAVAPYGAAAEQALRSAGLWDAVKDKLVLGQAIAQAAAFARSGSAQAALLPLSLAQAPPLSQEGRFVAVPQSAHAPILQAGVVIKGSRSLALARAFAGFLLGPAGRAALRRHGYGEPAAAAGAR